MAILAGVYLYGFTTYSSTMVNLEKWLLVSPARGLVFLTAGVAALIAFSSARHRDPPRLIYEEQSDTQIQSLGLN